MPALDLWTSCFTSWSLSSPLSEMGITVLTVGLLWGCGRRWVQRVPGDTGNPRGTQKAFLQCSAPALFAVFQGWWVGQLGKCLAEDDLSLPVDRGSCTVGDDWYKLSLPSFSLHRDSRIQGAEVRQTLCSHERLQEGQLPCAVKGVFSWPLLFPSWGMTTSEDKGRRKVSHVVF